MRSWWVGVMWCWLGELYRAMHKAIPLVNLVAQYFLVSFPLQENKQRHMPEAEIQMTQLVATKLSFKAQRKFGL